MVAMRERRGSDLVPIVGRGFPSHAPLLRPPLPLHGSSTRGYESRTGHGAIQGINWCGTFFFFLAHTAKAIK